MTLFTWSPGQYQALNPIWIMLLSPILAWAYTHFGKTGRDLPIAAKFALGFVVVALGFFIFGISGATAVEGKVSSWYMIWGYGFYSLGELLVSGLGLAMIARYVPARMGGFMMGAYFVATGISQYLGERRRELREHPGKPDRSARKPRDLHEALQQPRPARGRRHGARVPAAAADEEALGDAQREGRGRAFGRRRIACGDGRGVM